MPAGMMVMAGFVVAGIFIDNMNSAGLSSGWLNLNAAR